MRLALALRRPTESGAAFRSVLSRHAVAREHPNQAATARRHTIARSTEDGEKTSLDVDAVWLRSNAEDDPLDPVHRRRAALAPPGGTSAVTPATTAAPGGAAPSPRSLASLETLLPAMVRRVAWSGDGRRGALRLEVGAGELSGATLLVQADAGHVRVHLDVPAGVDARQWAERIRERLASHDIPADQIEVT
jgi:hypothetical protein